MSPSRDSTSSDPAGAHRAISRTLPWTRNLNNNHDWPYGFFAAYCSADCVDVAWIASDFELDYTYFP